MNADEILGRKTKKNERCIHEMPTDDMELATFETDLEEIFPPAFLVPAQATKTLKNKYPEIYKKFFPRIYNGTDKFEDWKRPHLIAAAHWLGTTSKRGLAYYEGVQAGTNAIQHTLRWYSCGLPCFFVSPAFYDAVRQTEVPANFDFNEMKWPFDSYTFILPKGVLFYKDIPVPYIAVSVCTKNVANELGEIKGSGWEKIIVTTSFGTSYFAPGFALSELSKFYQMEPDTFRNMADQAEMCSGEFEVNDAAFTLLLLKLALKLTIVMEAAPEHVERGHKIKSVVKHNVRREVWSPNIIGRKFQVKLTDGSAGTHASPRMHPRRGHFRQQRVGPKVTPCTGNKFSPCKHEKAAHYEGNNFCMVPDCYCGLYKPEPQKVEVVWVKPCWVNLKGGAA